ncbi:MAG: PEP-CTERM sorting domain-containing protein [Puniceicoccales bacterium]
MSHSNYFIAYLIILTAPLANAGLQLSMQATIVQSPDEEYQLGPAFALGEEFTLDFIVRDIQGPPNEVNNTTVAAWAYYGDMPIENAVYSAVNLSGSTGSLTKGVNFVEILAYSQDEGTERINILIADENGLGIWRNGEEVAQINVYEYPLPGKLGPLAGDDTVSLDSIFLPGSYGVNNESIITILTNAGYVYFGEISALNVTAIPEPSSYAIALGGFALLLSFKLRSSRRRRC